MNDNELYHYHGGLLYNYSHDELYHYGVPGMKWGKRKAKYDYAVEKLQAKQDAYRTHRGVTSSKFQKTALKLNKMKAKRDLADANVKGDIGAKIAAKEGLRAANRIKDVRKIKDLNLTDDEAKMIKRKNTVKNILKTLAAIDVAVRIDSVAKGLARGDYKLSDEKRKAYAEERERRNAMGVTIGGPSR